MAGSRSASIAIRGFVIAGVGFLVLWQAVVVAGVPHRSAMALGIYGFVFHVVFGKGYALIPAYFDRELPTAWGPRAHLPLGVLSVLALATAPALETGESLAAAGALAWGIGAVVFVATLIGAVRGNLLGAETGTGGANVHRAQIDRYANAFVPIALLYVLLGSYETIALTTAAPTLVGGIPAGTSHLLAAGTGGLLVLAIGSRLLPRLFVAAPPAPLVWVMLPAGAIGPVLIATGIGRPDGSLLQLGGVLQAIALLAYAGVIGALYRRSDRRRVGFYGVVLGAIAGMFAAGVGVLLAVPLGPVPGDLVAAHHRLTLVGFLGLTIVGVVFQFYPPGIGTVPGVDERTAGVAIAAIGAGLAVEVLGRVASQPRVAQFGEVAVLLGAIGVAYVVYGVFVSRWRR